MQKSKKTARFVSVLVGLVALTVIWMVAIRPSSDSNDNDGITSGETQNEDDSSSLDNAATEGSTSEPNDSPFENQENTDTPSPLAPSGPEDSVVTSISIIGIVVAAYLFVLNRRVKRDTKSLTYLQR